MEYVLAFFKKHRFITLHIIILAAAFFSFRYFIERLLFSIAGMGWAYLVDQTTPLFIAITASFLFLKRRTNLKTIHAKLKSHYRLLCLIFVTAFVTHLGILYYFFWAEEVNYILNPITQNVPFQFHQWGSSSMRGYFIASYAFLYLMFGLHAWVYPLFSISYFAISTLFVYWFLYLLTNRKLVATVASLFFATTPAYLDMFSWHTTAHAPTLILGLVSFILLLYYKKSGFFAYYILSVIFFFSAIKMGFIRSAGFTFIPLLLLLLPLYKKQVKQGSLSAITHWLPHIMITLYFVTLEFIHQELVNLAQVVEKAGNLTPLLNFFTEYRGVDSSLFLPKLLYFTVYLFIPSGLVAEILPFFRTTFPKTSMVLSLGILIFLGTLCALVIILKSRHTKEKWLVIFALGFVILNMLHNIIGYQASSGFSLEKAGSAVFIDRLFSREDIGYGPGSRYVFISAVGVSLLFALFIAWLLRRGGKLAVVAVLFSIGVIGGNTYFTVRAQVQNFKGMTLYRSLVDNIFRLVPRDGKPKLLFSANPESNSLDRKFGGWEWLHGFYRKDELLYTTNPQEVQEFVKSGRYRRENMYAFYHNRGTLAFTDISNEARNYFFSNSENVSQNIFIDFFPRGSKSTRKHIEEPKITLLGRAIIGSSELNKRLMAHQYFRFKLKMQKIVNLSFPFSDTIFIEKEQGYSYNFPLELWKRVALPPYVIDDAAALPKDTYDSPKFKQRQFQVINILKERDSLMAGTNINVSNIKDRDVITKESLIDGFYTTSPNPRKEEQYFVAEGSSIVLTLSFPYKTSIRRILLNTPVSYSSSVPKNITIFASLNNKQFNKIKTLENIKPIEWSPNGGKMYQIDFEKNVDASSIRLEITGVSKTVAFDEVIIDSENALMYTPQEIYETARTAYYYVDNKKLFEQLAGIRRYNRLTLVWACAEDSDWKRQLENIRELVPGVWNVAKINIPRGTDEIENRVALDCYGTKLRKVFFISPSYPAEIELAEAVLE